MQYNKTLSTNKLVKNILPNFNQNLEKKYFENPNLIIKSWPEIIGKNLADMTKVLCFKNNILYVLVKSSTLYSILKTQEKKRLLSLLQNKFSKDTIRNIIFKIG